MGRTVRDLGGDLFVLLLQLCSKEVDKHPERVVRLFEVPLYDLNLALKEIVLFAILEEVLESRIV